jgi:uncharacterized membrane protein YgcG
MSTTRTELHLMYEHLEIAFEMSRIALAVPGTEAGSTSIVTLQKSLLEISKACSRTNELVLELEARPFKCGFCGRGFATPQGMKRHVKSIHRDGLVFTKGGGGSGGGVSGGGVSGGGVSGGGASGARLEDAKLARVRAWLGVGTETTETLPDAETKPDAETMSHTESDSV